MLATSSRVEHVTCTETPGVEGGEAWSHRRHETALPAGTTSNKRFRQANLAACGRASAGTKS